MGLFLFLGLMVCVISGGLLSAGLWQLLSNRKPETSAHPAIPTLMIVVAVIFAALTVLLAFQTPYLDEWFN